MPHLPVDCSQGWRNSIYRTQYWDVVHAYNTSLPGWLVLVARRHIESLEELNEAESLELGVLIRRVSQSLKLATGCRKTYVVQFAEAAEHPHVHFHIIPRMADLPPEYCGPKIFGCLGVSEADSISEERMNESIRQSRCRPARKPLCKALLPG